MKSIALTFVVLCIFVSVVFSQSKDEQALRQTLNEVATALKSKDVTSLAKIYDDDYTFVNGTGEMFDKTKRLATIKSGVPLESFSYDDVKVRLYGNTALINTTVKLKNAGKDATVSQATLTMIKKNGRWQIVAAQSTPSASSDQSASASNQAYTGDEQALMQIEKELNDAVLKGDVSVREHYLGNNYTSTNPNGVVMTKAQGTADLRSGNIKITSSSMDDMKVQMYGTTGILTFHRTQAGSLGTNDISGQYRTTHVFVKQNGQWQLVSAQTTRLASPQ
jgi:ketosteroid isomerase-like protein